MASFNRLLRRIFAGANLCMAILCFCTIIFIAFNSVTQRKDVTNTSFLIFGSISLCGVYGLAVAILNELSHYYAYIIFISLILITLLVMVSWGLPQCTRIIVRTAWNNGNIRDKELKYHCCGMNGPHDYSEMGAPIPHSCYRKNKQLSEHILNRIGCIAAIDKKFKKNIYFLTLYGFGVIGIEASLLALSIYLVLAIVWKRVRDAHKVAESSV